MTGLPVRNHPPILCLCISALLMIGASTRASAAALKVECNTQFRLNAFDGAQHIDYPAVVPKSGGPSFQSYWLVIDWEKRTAVLNLTGFNDSTPYETYRVSSEPGWDMIVLNEGRSMTDNSAPILFYIRRNSGWFMKQVGLNKDKPTIDIVEVGVCGADRKF